MEIPVRVIDSRPIATITLNGSKVPMLVDSGAFFSMLSPATATQLQLPLRNLPYGTRIEGYAGRIEARQTTVETLGLPGAELNHIDFIVGGNELNAGIMGVLGRNILAAADTEYDLAHGVVRLSFPKGECANANLAYWAGEAPVIVEPLESSREDTAIRLNVAINGTRTVALLDTGAPMTALTLRAARRAGIEDRDLTPAGRVGGAGEGQVIAWVGAVARFELGGERITNNRLRVDNASGMGQGMVLGLDYFLSHRIYVSRLQRQVYVTWNGGPVFAQGRTTPGDYDARYAALPAEVSSDDADALARRGAAATAAGNYQRALDDLNRACELAPTVAENFYFRARVRLALQRPTEGLADLDEALRLDPAFADARIRRALVKSAAGERTAALSDLAHLDASLPPSAAGARADMAQLYAGFDQVAEALRQFELWIASHPTDIRLATALNNRCWLRARMNIDLPLALDDCKQAVDKDGGDPSVRDSLGWTYLRLGDAARAKQAFDGAIKLRAASFSLYGRGLAELRLNDAASGERDLEAARKLRPLIAQDIRKAGFEFAADAPSPTGP